MNSIRLSKSHFIRKSYMHNSVKFENTEDCKIVKSLHNVNKTLNNIDEGLEFIMFTQIMQLCLVVLAM